MEREPLLKNFIFLPGSRYGKIDFPVNQSLAVLIASITTFAVTNIDDAFLLTFFFARRIPMRRIVTGQYAGFAAIVAFSLIGVWGALAMPHRWIRLLGVLPLAIGIKRLFPWLILVVYAGLVSLWCFVGRWLGTHSLILRSVDRWGPWAVPLVFVGLGIYVLSS